VRGCVSVRMCGWMCEDVWVDVWVCVWMCELSVGVDRVRVYLES